MGITFTQKAIMMGAMAQFVKSIGRGQPSYVIRKVNQCVFCFIFAEYRY